MSLPPLWKVNRELNRVKKQMGSLAYKAGLAALRVIWFPVKNWVNRVHDGAEALGPKVAIYLLFQPNGIPASLKETIARVRDLGYSILFISNVPVSPEDLAYLRQMGWKVMLRPNIGYDFGGYRDGIFFLIDKMISPEKLLVLNDTFWLPVAGGPCSLAGFDALPAPYTALSNFVYRSHGSRPAELVRRTYSSSFAFAVTREVFDSRVFRRFWRGMQLTAEKSLVVMKGEVGFSKAMADAGYAPGWFLDHRKIEAHVAGLDESGVEAFLLRLPVMNKTLRPDYEAFIDKMRRGEASAEEKMAMAQRLLPHLNPWDSFAYYGLWSGQISFIKKANFKHPGNARRLLAMVDSDGFPLEEAVRADLETYAALPNPEDARPAAPVPA